MIQVTLDGSARSITIFLGEIAGPIHSNQVVPRGEGRPAGIKPTAFFFSTGKGQSVWTKAVFDPEANFSVEGNPLDWFPGTFFQHENLAFVPSVRHRRIDQLFHRLPRGKLVSGLGDTPFRD